MSEELALAVKDAVSVVNDPHMGVSIGYCTIYCN